MVLNQHTNGIKNMLILVTSAEVDHLKEMRTKEYEKTIEWAKIKDSEGYNIVWLECISDTEPSYLKPHSNNQDKSNLRLCPTISVVLSKIDWSLLWLVRISPVTSS